MIEGILIGFAVASVLWFVVFVILLDKINPFR